MFWHYLNTKLFLMCIELKTIHPIIANKKKMKLIAEAQIFANAMQCPFVCHKQELNFTMIAFLRVLDITQHVQQFLSV